MGAISGVVTAGIGHAFSGSAGILAGSGWQPLAQAGAHALFQGGMAAAQGGNFWQGATSAFGSSLIAGASAGSGAVAQSMMGAFTGGFISHISGGNFVEGFATGLTVSALNHGLHSALHKNNDPPIYEYNGKKYTSKAKLYTDILVDQAAEQFGIKDIAALAGVISGQPILPTRGKFQGATKGTSVASKYLSRIPGNSPVPLPTVTGTPKLIGGKGMKIALTKTIGRFIGRAVPFVGWAVLAYDTGVTLYKTQTIYNSIVEKYGK